MGKSFTKFIALLLLLCGVLFLVGSLLIPAHWNSVDKSVLRAAGQKNPKKNEIASKLLQWGMTSPAMRVAKIEPESQSLIDAIEQKISENPLYKYSGGAEQYFNAYLESLKNEGIELKERNNLMALLSNQVARERLAGYLGNSGKPIVQKILNTRDLSGLQTFMPADSAAGAPYEAMVYTTALLLQSGYMPTGTTDTLVSWAEQALAGKDRAKKQLESFYMTLLSLSYRLNWLEIATLVNYAETPRALERFARLTRNHEKNMNLLYSVVLLDESVKRFMDYIRKYGYEKSVKMIKWCIPKSVPATKRLLNDQKPLFEPQNMLAKLRPPELAIYYVLEYPQRSLGVRIAAMLLGAYCLLAGSLRVIFRNKPEVINQHDGYPLLRNCLISALLTTLLLTLLEGGQLKPQTDQSQMKEAGIQFIGFAQSNNPDQGGFMNQITTDTTTMVILLLFFVVQLIVYFLGLVKISQIRNVMGDAPLRKNLLDNEENFFDSGLYIGLGGTVASLILLAMNVVSASLIAAYASTLFGIIFTALLKIFHVRPCRRSLILEESSNHIYKKN